MIGDYLHSYLYFFRMRYENTLHFFAASHKLLQECVIVFKLVADTIHKRAELFNQTKRIWLASVLFLSDE